MRLLIKRGVSLIVLTILLVLFGITSLASATITIDGQFSDWEGQANLADAQESDPADFDTYPDLDLKAFYWANNPGQENLYFMLERYFSFPNQSWDYYVTTTLYFDVNDNGNYKNRGDCYANVEYQTRLNSRSVVVNVYRYKNKGVTYVGGYSGNWGESDYAGGSRWEFYIPMDDLGIQLGQSIRMYAASTYSGNNIDRVPDQGDIQWSPIAILGKWGWVVLMIVGLTAAVIMLWKRGKLWAG